jgi:hypothetical protein
VRGGFRLSPGIGVWALTATLLLAATPASADAKRRTCSKAGSTIAASAGARVYSLPPRNGFEFVYACRYRTGRRVLLGTRGDCQNQAQVRHVALAGPFVGHSIRSCGIEDEGSSSIAVVDLRTRRTFRSARAVGSPPPGVTEVSSAVSELVLKPNGSVAWIGVAEHASGSESTLVSEVRKIDAGGEALVDSGGTLAALALARSTLYWTKDGRASATELR